MSEDTPMTAAEIVEKSKRYTLYDWQAQSKASPIAVDRAEGVYFWDVDGKRYLDFNSQLMGVNIGHGDKRVADAIGRQAEKLPYISPFMAYETGPGSARSSPRSGPATSTRRSSRSAARRRTRTRSASRRRSRADRRSSRATGSYHGATYATINLTGDPRRWANENPPMPGIVHVLDPYRGTARGTEDAATALATLEETIELEGPQTIAAFILETVTGTNGILDPARRLPRGRPRALRPPRDRADRRRDHVRVRAHGRVVRGEPLGRRPRPDDRREGAHVLVPAARRRGDQAGDRTRTSRSTSSTGGSRTTRIRSRCAAAIAAIDVLEEDDLVGNAKRLDPVMTRHHEELMTKHPSVGRVRNIGLFGILELVKSRDTMEPLSPYNVVNETMQAVNKALLERGLFTMIRFNGIMTNPPLCITEEQLEEGFAIIDEALEIADRAVSG